MQDSYTTRKHPGQSPETELVNKWLNKRYGERAGISMLCVAAAAGIGFLAFRYAGSNAFALTVAGVAAMLLIMQIALNLHAKITLHQLHEAHPELWDIKNRYTGHSPLDQVEYYTKIQKKWAGCGGIMLLVLCAAVALGVNMFLSTFAAARVELLNKNAKNVYITVNTWLEQPQNADFSLPQTLIVNFDEEYPEGSLEDAMQDTLQSESRYIRTGMRVTRVPAGSVDGGCAVLRDETGEILYTFWSETPLTEADLVPADADTQLKQEHSLSGSGTVGWFAP